MSAFNSCSGYDEFPPCVPHVDATVTSCSKNLISVSAKTTGCGGIFHSCVTSELDKGLVVSWDLGIHVPESAGSGLI
jgi:hypothetical protein